MVEGGKVKFTDTGKRKSSRSTPRLKESYPAIAEWASGWGWIEVGEGGTSGRRGIVARALDEGGLIWESKTKFENADQAFKKLDAALGKIMEAGL